MKFNPFNLLALGFAVFAISCSGPENGQQEAEKASLNVSPLSIKVAASPASTDVYTFNVTSNVFWTAKTNDSWIHFSPSSGKSSGEPQTVTVVVDRNKGEARTGKIAIEASDRTATVTVDQENGKSADGIETVSIAEFRSKADDPNVFYRLTAEIISVEDEGYGDIYVMDDTGYLYVYGMAPQKGGNKTDYSKLGLVPGDVVTFVGYKKKYNSIVEADGVYYESHTKGTYPGFSTSVPKAGWIELPAAKQSDNTVFVCHMIPGGGRNYSSFYNKADHLSQWVAYTLYPGAAGEGRSDAYAFDPLVPSASQANLKKSYQNRTIGAEEYIRGHMVPSNDRKDRANLDVYLSTNIMPQSYELNSGLWVKIEQAARNWAERCDTVYVVVGTDTSNSVGRVTDNSATPRQVVVPGGLYRAALAFDKKKGEYRGIAVYVENKANAEKSLTKSLVMSIDDLEKKLGMDFFHNLPDDIEKAVEAANPADDSWWWNN